MRDSAAESLVIWDWARLIAVVQIVLARTYSALRLTKSRHRSRDVRDRCSAFAAVSIVSLPMPRPPELTTFPLPLRSIVTWAFACSAAPANVDGDAGVVLGAGAAAAAKADIGGLAVNFTQQRGEFLIQSVAIARKSAGSGLRSQALQLVQNVRNVVQTAVDGLQNTGAIVGVAYALGQLVDRAAEPVCDGEASSIVAGRINTEAGSQPGDGL